nr:family 20 glycosylhydrolase [Candidatus Sigynarchaeota archaeon]
MELCQMYGIESIPLVQTFGHLEFVLKHDQYKHLLETRAVQGYAHDTLDICPLQEGTMPLLEDMIGDVVSYHPKSRFFHVGGDEVYSIGTCPDCRKYVIEQGNGDISKGKSKLYIMHVNRIARVVKGFGKIPMIWHDYLLKYPEFIDELDKDFIIVYWRYGKDKHPDDFEREIAFFKQKGFKVLAASSVRSDFQFAIPNYSTRFQNIHELHKALMTTPDHVAGALATSWAVCRSPMETTVLGLLFFADSAWNVKKGPYTEDVLLDATRRMNKIFFGIPDEFTNKHENVLLMLQQATLPPQQSNDLNALDETIGAAMKAWDAILSDAKTGLSVIHNIQHGLGLQR